jgi:hypothetical protein
MLTTIIIIALLFWLFANYAPVRTVGGARRPFVSGGVYVGPGVGLVLFVILILALTGRI